MTAASATALLALAALVAPFHAELFLVLFCILVLGAAVAIAVRASWDFAKAQYVKALSEGASKSRIAAGLEQGLRELPLLVSGVDPKHRSQVVAALSSAVRPFYPEFAAKEAQRIEEILTTGKIRGENQFCLVRHRIDELEGSEDQGTQLGELCRLVDEFEARPRR